MKLYFINFLPLSLDRTCLAADSFSLRVLVCLKGLDLSVFLESKLSLTASITSLSIDQHHVPQSILPHAPVADKVAQTPR